MSILKNLESKMTDSEKAELGKQLSDIQIKIQELLDKKVMIPKEIALLQEEASKLALYFKSGLIRKEVECMWLLDENKWEKTLVRTDTNEKVETAPMSWFDFDESPETAFEMLFDEFHKPDGQGYMEFHPANGVEALKHRFPVDRATQVVKDLDSSFFMTGPGTVVIESADYPKAKKIIAESFTVGLVEKSVPDNNAVKEEKIMDTSYEVEEEEKIELEEN